MRSICLALALLASLPLAACEAGTGGRIVHVDLAIARIPARHAPTSTGWHVTLDEACVALGPIYLYEGGGILAQRSRSPLPDWLVRTAHAHAGDQHFNGGEVKGEWLEQRSLDLTVEGGELLGTLVGSAGTARSLSVLLDPPRKRYLGEDACLRGHHAYVVGTAERDGAEVPFEGGLDIDNQGTRRRVDGIRLAGELDDGKTVELTVDARAWFAQADFGTLEKKNERGRFEIEPGSQPHAAWFLGLRGVSAYTAHIR
jgi:hypothetical protein